MMSSLEAPAGTMGYTFSKASVRKSMTTGRSSIPLAFSMAGATSSARLHPEPDAAHGLGPLDVVGEVGRQVDLGVALLVEQLLPLAHHAQVGVVQDGHLDGDALGRGGDELLGRHLEAAVAVDGPHHLVGPAHLGPDGGGHGEAHGARAAGVDPRVGVVERQYCDAHIWCWPTPDTTMVSSGVTSRSVSTTYWGLSAPPSSWS